MDKSYIQDDFLQVFADGHVATAKRINHKINSLEIPDEAKAEIKGLIIDEIQGLFHGSLVVLDNGSNLADEGMIRIIDEDGVAFQPNLHETAMDFYNRKIDR